MLVKTMAEEYSSMMNETETEGSSRTSSILSLHYSSCPSESHCERQRDCPSEFRISQRGAEVATSTLFAYQ